MTGRDGSRTAAEVGSIPLVTEHEQDKGQRVNGSCLSVGTPFASWRYPDVVCLPILNLFYEEPLCRQKIWLKQSIHRSWPQI